MLLISCNLLELTQALGLFDLSVIAETERNPDRRQ